MLWQFFSLPGIENGIEYRYFSRYRIEVRNSSIVTTLLPIRRVLGHQIPEEHIPVAQTKTKRDAPFPHSHPHLMFVAKYKWSRKMKTKTVHHFQVGYIHKPVKLFWLLT